MDVRKVQSIVKEIYAGGDIKVNITEDLDSLNNGDRIIAIGSHKTISYQYHTSAEMMANYFSIIDESNSQLLALINKYTIQGQQYFPVFGFSSITSEIEQVERLKQQQMEKVQSALNSISESCKTDKSTIDDILGDESITASNKNNAILWSLMNGKISLADTEAYLKSFENKSDTPYRKLLCAYDLKKYSN